MEVDLHELALRIQANTELAAIAVIKQLNPAFDEVKQTEAYEIAGSRRWFNYHKRKGNITPLRRGNAPNSPIFYSRLEIAALKRAEAEFQQTPIKIKYKPKKIKV